MPPSPPIAEPDLVATGLQKSYKGRTVVRHGRALVRGTFEE